MNTMSAGTTPQPLNQFIQLQNDYTRDIMIIKLQLKFIKLLKPPVAWLTLLPIFTCTPKQS
jgi:hypothetical protein